MTLAKTIFAAISPDSALAAEKTFSQGRQFSKIEIVATLFIFAIVLAVLFKRK